MMYKNLQTLLYISEDEEREKHPDSRGDLAEPLFALANLHQHKHDST